MQSVDDPRPDGLTWDEGIAVAPHGDHLRAGPGLQVAIYNPDIDPDGEPPAGQRAAQALAD